jgi:prepilin-type N-terminal cleavage/methylation domain-containing protein
MKRLQIAKHQINLSKKCSGFSLIEVLVAFSILVIILVIVLESRLGSVRRIEQTGDLNQLQDVVRADLANIRKQALKWQCVQGTACTGLRDDRDNPSLYNDSHCESISPLSNFPIQTETLLSNSNNNIELIRTVEASGSRLDISYKGNVRDKSFNTSTSIIPQAMNWCG